MGREELAQLEPQLEPLERQLKLCLLPTEPNDAKNAILEIRAGTGGDEAALFAGDLFRAYARYAERQGWKLEVLDENSTELGGFKEVIATLSGERVYSRLKFEGGVHRVQRVPATEAVGPHPHQRRHRGRAARGRGCGRAHRGKGPAHRPVLLLGPRRAERQHHLQRHPHHPPPQRAWWCPARTRRARSRTRPRPSRSSAPGCSNSKRTSAWRSSPPRASPWWDRATAPRRSAPTTSPRTAAPTTASASPSTASTRVLNGDFDLILGPLLETLEAERIEAEFAKVVG